jgi:hypothetical protein
VRTLRLSLLVFLLAPALALLGVPSGTASTERAASQVDANVVRAIHDYRAKTTQLQLVMGVRRTTRVLELTRRGRPSARRALALWRNRARTVKRRYLAGPPHSWAWQCIHRYEGSWTDPGAPYYGGLQMDISFQRSYGWHLLRVKGTADHWTPLEQMWVAEKAYRSGRRFYPWPNTARSCGLI